MRVLTSAADLSAALDGERATGRRVGFVPTMGFLHVGHRSLIEASVEADDVTAVSIFVNPLQFGPSEDLAGYPRDLDADLAVCRDAGAAYVFAPSVEEMYPRPMATSVTVTGVSAGWEGASRPGHFGGVATVVTKLLAIAGRCRAYFGEKDFQQLAVVRRLVADLSLPVEVVGCPTVREPDGLARSSRNVYLTAAERSVAPALYAALDAGRRLIESGEHDPAVITSALTAPLAAEPLLQVDYVAVVDPDTLEVPTRVEGDVRLLVAARLGRARLIDNLGARCPVPVPSI